MTQVDGRQSWQGPLDPERLSMRGGSIEVDTATGALVAARLGGVGAASGRDAMSPASTGRTGLLRIALPREDYPSHYLETGAHAAPQVERRHGGLRLVYPELASAYVTVPIRVEVDIEPREEGLVLRAKVHNGSDQVVPQVAFPQLFGLAPVGGTESTRLRMSRGTVHPLKQLVLRPDDATLLELPLQAYYGYGAFEFSMKWLDYGDTDGGLTLYSRDPRYRAQGLLVDRPDRLRDDVDLRWLHYPSIAPGQTWESGDFVLLLHEGDWHAGARAFREFAAETYRYDAPQPIREALGFRTVWPAIRNAPPTFMVEDLPAYAEEIADPTLGLAELCVWHWWRKNGLPIILDHRLGTEDDLRTAIARCRDLGVPVSLFVSHHLLRDTDETPDGWRHLNAAGQPVQADWTYGRDYLPRWHVPFGGTHAMMRGSALAKGWREAALAQYDHFLGLGAASICFDQFRSWFEPDHNPAFTGHSDEEGDALLDFGRQAHALVRRHDANGTFSGEMPTEQKVPILDYTWEWRNAVELEEDAPFRVVFPHVRLNANVNEHPRGALIAFADGGFINVMPGQMHSFRLADCPELVGTLRSLAALRRRYLRYFCEGDYLHTEGLTASGCHARAYVHGHDILVVVLNPTDEPAPARVCVDPTVWGGVARARKRTVVGLDGADAQSGTDDLAGQAATEGHLVFSGTLQSDGLRVVEFRVTPG